MSPAALAWPVRWGKRTGLDELELSEGTPIHGTGYARETSEKILNTRGRTKASVVLPCSVLKDCTVVIQCNPRRDVQHFHILNRCWKRTGM